MPTVQTELPSVQLDNIIPTDLNGRLSNLFSTTTEIDLNLPALTYSSEVTALTYDKVPTLSYDKIPALTYNEVPALTYNEVPALTCDEVPALAYTNEVPALTYTNEVPALTYIEPDSKDEIELFNDVLNVNETLATAPLPIKRDNTLQPMEIDLTPLRISSLPLLPPPLPEIPIMIDEDDTFLPDLSPAIIALLVDVTLPA